MRPALACAELREGADHDLVVLSPGPGRPSDFAMAETLELLVQRRLPVFGVCLGLQGIVEYFGGSLAVLDVPVHGKPSLVRVRGGRLLGGLPGEFTVGRYHSLHARRSTLPSELTVTADTADGVIMAVEHVSLPIAAVQFHPESVMTLRDEVGMPIIAAVIDWSAGVPPASGLEARGPKAPLGQNSLSSTSRWISTGKRARKA